MRRSGVVGVCVLVGAGAIVSGACSSGGAATGPDASCDEFLAPSDGTAFNNFCNWNSAPAMNSEDAGDGVHSGGPLTVYWNNSPHHGSTTFPKGTIILKESQESNSSMRTAFAMVNRGCGYNADGATNWEWWSLADNGNCTMTMLWRGPVPLMTEVYSGKPAGDCNGCHGMVVDNDYVWDTALQLSNF